MGWIMQKNAFHFQTEIFHSIWEQNRLPAVKTTDLKPLRSIQKCDKNLI